MHARELSNCTEAKGPRIVGTQSGNGLLDDLLVEQVLVAGKCLALLRGLGGGRAIDNNATTVVPRGKRICRRSDPACY
jgi:hypothetical protein